MLSFFNKKYGVLERVSLKHHSLSKTTYFLLKNESIIQRMQKDIDAIENAYKNMLHIYSVESTVT